MTSIFLSYSRLDKHIAQFLADQLVMQGVDVFIDYQKLEAGEDVVSRLGGEIEKRDYFVLIVSPRSLASDWVKSEVSWALHNKKHIIPVVIEPASYRDFFFLIRLENIDLTVLRNQPKIDDKVVNQLEKLFHALGVGRGKKINKETLILDFPVISEIKEFTMPSIKRGEIEDIYFSAIEQAQDDPESAVFLFSTVLDLDPDYMNGHAQELINKEIEKLKPERVKKLEENLDMAVNSQNYKSIFHISTDLIELQDNKKYWSRYADLLRGCVISSLESGDVVLVAEICNFLQKKDYDPSFINEVLVSVNQQEKNNLIYYQLMEAAKTNRWNVIQKLIAQIKENNAYFVKREIPKSLFGNKISEENSFFLIAAFEKNKLPPVVGVRFVGDNQVFFATDSYGCIWDFDKNIILQELKGETDYTHPKPIFDVDNKLSRLVFAEWDKQYEAMSTGGFAYELVIKDFQKNGGVSHLQFPSDTTISCLKFSSEKDYVFGGVSTGSFYFDFSNDIWIWNMESKKVVDQLIGHIDSVTTLEHIANGNLLLSGDYSGIVMAWDLNSGRIQKILSGKFQAHKVGRNVTYEVVQRKVAQIRFSEEAKLIAARYSDGSLTFWNYPEFRRMLLIGGEESKASSMDFSPDGKLFVTGGKDGNLKLWQTNTGNLIDVYWGHRAGINSVSFSRNQKYIVTGSSDGTVRIWGLENRRELDSNFD